jgi:hypothetical protein
MNFNQGLEVIKLKVPTTDIGKFAHISLKKSIQGFMTLAGPCTLQVLLKLRLQLGFLSQVA